MAGTCLAKCEYPVYIVNLQALPEIVTRIVARNLLIILTLKTRTLGVTYNYDLLSKKIIKFVLIFKNMRYF